MREMWIASVCLADANLELCFSLLTIIADDAYQTMSDRLHIPVGVKRTCQILRHFPRVRQGKVSGLRQALKSGKDSQTFDRGNQASP